MFAYAQDASFAGGSLGALHADTIVRILELAGRARAPVVGFIESGGARLQEGVSALGGYGRIFRANAALSGRVPQISVITGTSAGGGSYSPALTDFVIMTREAAMFLTGPGVVREVMGEDVGAAELGGTGVHERNGVCHCVAEDSAGAIALARDLLAYLPQSAWSQPEPGVPEPPATEDPGAVVPARPAARSTTCARSIGRARRRRRASSRSRRAGRATSSARSRASRAARSASWPTSRACSAACSTPTRPRRPPASCARATRTGCRSSCSSTRRASCPGTRQERGGVIRHGAKLLHAFAEATVPRLTVVLRKAYGGAYITMNSKDLGAHLSFAWPERRDRRDGRRAGRRHRRTGATSPTRRTPTPCASRLAAEYADEHLAAAAAAREGFVDEVIEPADTRARLAWGLSSLPARDGRTRRPETSPCRKRRAFAHDTAVLRTARSLGGRRPLHHPRAHDHRGRRGRVLRR